MSWTQGVQLREELPHSFVRFLDSKSEGYLAAIIWDVRDQERFTATYYKNNKHFEDKQWKIGK